ncbi:glycosyltransferase [Leucobacter luti]|uniref:GT2 family glycosyltransferase n=1 Tax=Leucobacter luti TaxID=340320 RepID=A0A4Q7U0M1_9MICO|nr:glycosyltransferase [Leucobacter luti]RZT66290.1 GT2 family glycosyltransferase [Leucobacter luti]
MRTRVTVILVAQQGGEWLDQTIAGITAQSLAPAAIIAVNNGGSERVSEQLMTSGAERVIGLGSRVSFGQAVAQGVQAAGLDAGDPETSEWLWLLSEDACPEPAALEHIVSAVQRAPSVAVAGPKLVDWDRPEHIIELGQSLTRYGSRWTLRRQELDQQQYDHMQDVLGVGPVGMLVRRDVWEELGGFDPALPVYDDGLDFSVRARLSVHRVEVAPASRVRFAQSGVAGPRIDRKRSVLRQAHRQARTAHLHRRIAYAPAPIAFLAWLGLPLLGLFRVLWALIREQPGHMLGEFVAAMSVFLRPHAILASRRRIRAHNTAGWAAIRQLRIDPKSVRTARMIDREAILASSGRQRRELHFISSGGLAVLATSLVITIALTWWALPRTNIAGGGLAPLSDLGQLWWNTRALDGVPADPFAWVLALLGSLTFWNPSHAIVLLVIAAIPLTALGAWIWAAQLTESRAGRAVTALGFALSPVLLGSIDTGRLPTLVLTIVLPWLLLAATRSRESWSWAGTASLLAGIALAAAPILLPAAILIFIVGLFTTLRGAARVLTTALVPLVLFAPKIVTSVIAGRPLDILLDPGVVLPFTPGTTWHLLLGFPEFGLEGWGGILDGIGLGGPPATLLVGVLMLPIALLAVLGIFTGRVAVTLLSALLGGLGMLTAIAAAQLQLIVLGDESVALWTGSGLAVYWLAVLSLAAVGAGTLRRAATPIVAVALVGAVVAVIPVGTQLFLGRVPFGPATAQMPALVQAAGETQPGTKTLAITAEAPHAVRVEVVTGSGLRLDQIRSADRTPENTAADRAIADLTGGLASVGGADLSAELRDTGIGFVLLSDHGNDVERAELQRVFDQHDSLVSAGQTEQGLLWRVADPEADAAAPGDATEMLGGTSFSGQTIWVIQLIVLLGVLLLALPTGEVTYRPERRRKPSRWKRRSTAKAAERASAAAAAAAAASVTAADPAAAPASASAANAASADAASPEAADADFEAADAGPESADDAAGTASVASAEGTNSADSVSGVPEAVAEPERPARAETPPMADPEQTLEAEAEAEADAGVDAVPESEPAPDTSPDPESEAVPDAAPAASQEPTPTPAVTAEADPANDADAAAETTAPDAEPTDGAAR